MSDVKALPDNLEELEKDIEFKKTYKKYTVDELELQLMEGNIEFLTADNKSALVWRLLDSQGYGFGATGDDNADTQGGDEPIDAPTSDADVVASDDATIDGSPDSDNSAVTIDEPVAEPASETNNTEQGDSDATNDLSGTSGIEALPGSDNVDSDNDMPVEPETTGEPAIESDETTTDSEDVDDRDFVEVANSGDFDMLEPSTSTLVAAGKTTKIYTDGRGTKDQILRNIEQYNYTRGNKLTITN